MSTPIIRGLTLWRPWAAAIVHGPKRVENRPWAPPLGLVSHGLWLAIHAGKRWDAEGARFIAETWAECPAELDRDEVASGWPPAFSAEGIIGVARVREVRRLAEVTPAHYEWAFGPWCWLLDDVRALPKPIPCRGAQGLWSLPPEVLAVLEPLCVERPS